MQATVIRRNLSIAAAGSRSGRNGLCSCEVLAVATPCLARLWRYASFWTWQHVDESGIKSSQVRLQATARCSGAVVLRYSAFCDAAMTPSVSRPSSKSFAIHSTDCQTAIRLRQTPTTRKGQNLICAANSPQDTLDLDIYS